MRRQKTINRKLLFIVVFTAVWMLGIMITVYLSYVHRSPVPLNEWQRTTSIPEGEFGQSLEPVQIYWRLGRREPCSVSVTG